VTVVERLERIEALLNARANALLAPEFYSIRQAAKVVGVSADHLRRAVTNGVLPASNVGTMSRPTYRISRADLLAWVERGKAGATLPASRRKTVIPQSRHHRPPRGHSDARGS
jgi:excisionase family DNA binding protein